MTERHWRPTHAMVLAAGRGERMRPITDQLPKPLVEVAGQAMLDTVLDRLADFGVMKAVVNVHHLAERVERHLAERQCPPVVISREEDLLDTGGGVAKALPELGDDAFLVCNGDVCWLDGGTPAFERMARAWDDARMDALLLLQSTVWAFGYEGDGDFVMDPLGRLRRRREREIAPFVFAGIQLLHPRLFADAPSGAFSLNRIYDMAMEEGRLWGLRHDGEWFHVGTPQALEEVGDLLHPRTFLPKAS